MTTKKTLMRAVPVALALLAGSQAPALADGSLSYIAGGDVQLAAPDGSGARTLTSGGGWRWPSQADDGTIVAVRQTSEGGRNPRRLHRMDRTGAALGSTLEPLPVDNSYYVGPLAPKISPDGALIAYHYFYTGPLSDEPTKPRTSLTYSDRSTPNGVITATLGGYFTPSWLQDGRLLAFYAKQRTFNVDIWNRDDTVTNWFGDPEVETLLTDGEVTRAGDRLAAIGEGGELRLYELPGAPPAEPRLACKISGDVSEPTWSPDGRSLAWEEADGIHVAALPDLAACASAARPLVIAGGSDPDWGVAPPPAMPGGGGDGTPDASDPPPHGSDGPGAKTARLTIARRALRSALARGLAVRVRGARAGKRKLVAKAGKTAVAGCTVRVTAGGSGRCTLRFTAKGRRVLRAKRRVTLRVTGAGTAAKVTLKR